jgi:hypothetical protein
MQPLSRVVRLSSGSMLTAMSSPPPEFQALNVLSALMLLYCVRFTLLGKLQHFSDAERRLAIKASHREHARHAAL